MTDRVEAVFEDALALGRANQETVELARRHCLNMTFTKWEGGGQGMAEQMSGLPIDTRRISCLMARSNTAGMNLAVLARDFYEMNCIGCSQRRPTGEVPTLATVVEAARQEEAALADEEEAEGLRRRLKWQSRVEHRRALAATADPAMAGVLEDLAILDLDPIAPSVPDTGKRAAQRIQALADQAPHTFTADVITHTIELVDDGRVTAALGPLRHLARHRDDVAPLVAEVALRTLARSPVIEAGQCLADLVILLQPADLTANIIRSLVWLAGPTPDPFHTGSDPADPSGLRAAASTAPEAVAAVLQDMLPPPRPPSPLLVPPGTGPQDHAEAMVSLERVKAAAAIAALAATHPEVASQLTTPLVANLSSYADEWEEPNPTAALQHTVAVMLVLGIEEVAGKLEAAAASGGDDEGERLFGALTAANTFLTADHPWREPGDPRLDDNRQRAVFDELVSASLARLSPLCQAVVRHSPLSNY